MKIKKLIEKVDDFFKKSKKKQNRKKKHELLEKLVAKGRKIKDKLKSKKCICKKDEEDLKDDLKAVYKLIKKARK